jgi:uncharacterized protein (TIGR02147 family)
MISVYDYMDYRCFLKDRFFDLKKKKPGFSYRVFNRQAGIKSSGFLKLVIDGKRNLADEGIRKIACGFRMSEAEERYFELLVKFNQVSSLEEKDRYFRELSLNKKFLAAKPLAAGQYRLFSHWYYVAILEAVRIETREIKNLSWLQRVIHPPLSIKHIKKAVRSLMEWGLLQETKSGGLRRLENMITTEDEVKSLSVAKFHVQMCQMAARAVMQDETHDREFSALTIVTSEESFQKAKSEIQKFRKKLHSILEQENNAPKIFVSHLNFHLFKLTKGATNI